MNVELTVQDKSGKVYVYQTFENKELFVGAVADAYDLHAQFGKIADKDEVVSLFSKGATIKKADFNILRRSLRHYDEVYLCNEFCDILEEIPNDIILLTVGKIGKAVDLSGYKI